MFSNFIARVQINLSFTFSSYENQNSPSHSKEFKIYPSTLQNFSSGVGPLWSSISCFACKSQWFLFHLCMLGGSVWISMKSNLLLFIEDKTQLRTSWHAKMSLIDIECSSFKPPHYYLQACNKNLPNKEHLACKTTNSRPQVLLC